MSGNKYAALDYAVLEISRGGCEPHRASVPLPSPCSLPGRAVSHHSTFLASTVVSLLMLH